MARAALRLLGPPARARAAFVILWLVLVVVAADVGGYFAGRTIGGPKFWPRVSPGKTWAGTVGGLVAAALVGLVFVLAMGWSPGWALACSASASRWPRRSGDLLESAMKRQFGVKDSSR